MPAPRTEQLRFELASQEIIDLLVGNKIYDDPPRVVVRELLQNGVDACRLRRAVEGQGYRPRITLTYVPRRGGRPGRLTVADNGIGMSEFVAKRYFLQIGKSYYSSPDFKERWGRYSAFAPIARFGVGALSCFLVADRVEVHSRHLDEAEAPIRLEIEGLHNLIRFHTAPAGVPVGTRIDLDLRAGIDYRDLEEIVRHWARHVEVPIEVNGAEVPPDDGASFARSLLDPACAHVLDAGRAGMVRTRRLEFDEDGLRGFIEYAYVAAPGHVRRFSPREAIIDFDLQAVPQAVCLDGIYVTRELPTFLTGFRDAAVAYDIGARSRETGLQLRLDRTHFVEGEALSAFTARLDAALVEDIIDLLRSADLQETAYAYALGDLIDPRALERHEEETGSNVAWVRLGKERVFALRLDGERRFYTWPAFSRHRRVARVRVGGERVAWPSFPHDYVTNFWWSRHHRLVRHLGGRMPLLTSYDTTDLTEAFLARHYTPAELVVEAGAGTTFLVYGRGAAGPDWLGPLPCLPFTSGHLLTYWDGWYLNSRHPLVTAALARPAADTGRSGAARALSRLVDSLRGLPDAARVAAAQPYVQEAAAQLGVAAPAEIMPAHDQLEYWEAEMLRYQQYGPQ